MMSDIFGVFHRWCWISDDFSTTFEPTIRLDKYKTGFYYGKKKLTHQKVLNLIQFGSAIIFNHTNIAMDQW
jgi:hypothetical protein